jgi:HlyD family secretion protein
MLVIICIVIAAFLLPFISVDITTQTRGVIRTQSENTLLQSAVYGEVKTINVSENQNVHYGDVLVLIKTDKIDEQIAERKRDFEENKLFISDLKVLIYGTGNLQSAKYQRENGQYTTKSEELSIQLKMLKHEYELKKHLFEKEVVAEMEYLQQKNKYDVAISQFNLAKKQFQNQWQSELTHLTQVNHDLLSEIEQLNNEKQLYVITAPVAGVITNVTGIRKGSFLVPNQQVGQISPNEAVLVECYVSPANIGFIKEGQQAKFQFDAFNYNQWGMAQGMVNEISTDIYSVNNQPVFKVRCSLDAEYLQLKNGYKGQLKKGMTLTTRFYLTERTLWQLMFDKVDDWMNPKLLSN